MGCATGFEPATSRIHNIGSGRVDPADHLDAVPESLVEQFGGARIGEHAVLREGHLLDGDLAAEALPGRPHRSTPASPWSVTTSVCVRTWAVPDATIRSSSAVICSTSGSSSSARRRRSSAMRSASAGPAECGTQRPPNKVLSTWQCASMRPGSSRRPGTSTTSAAGSARRSGPIRSMTPSRIRTSAGAPSATGARRATTDQAWTLPIQMAISPAADPRAGRCAPGTQDRRQRDSDPRYRSPASG